MSSRADCFTSQDVITGIRWNMDTAQNSSPMTLTWPTDLEEWRCRQRRWTGWCTGRWQHHRNAQQRKRGSPQARWPKRAAPPTWKTKGFLVNPQDCFVLLQWVITIVQTHTIPGVTKAHSKQDHARLFEPRRCLHCVALGLSIRQNNDDLGHVAGVAASW